MATPQAAARVIKKFRLQEIKSFPQHLLRFGPLISAAPVPIPFAGKSVAKLPNPFIPWKNPKTGRWVDPKYSLRRQAELVKKAKASGTLHLLPPGPKLPTSVLKQELEKVKAQEKIAKAEAKKQRKAEAKLQRSTPMPMPSTPVPAAETLITEPETAVETAADVKAEAATEVAGKQNQLLDELWTQPVSWHGHLGEKQVAGGESGTRLYAAKRRMFKGHKWERVKGRRIVRTQILMRDMAKRIRSYKNFYKRGKPNPLKPPRSAKAPKLPF